MRLFIIFILATSYCNGQNLVPNGGFEQGVPSETTSNLDSDCDNWFGSIQSSDIPPVDIPSPDWWHTGSITSGLRPPYTYLGFQQPFEGNGFAGLMTIDPPFDEYREIIGIQLSESLEQGTPYLVGFAFNKPNDTGNSSNNLGVKFTSYQYFSSVEAATNNFTHFNINSIITDTLNWHYVEFEFTPDSSYSFMHLGNFYDDSETSIDLDPGPFAYYFVDDVSVSSTLSTYMSKGSSYQVYPNPASNYLRISGINSAHTDIVLLTLAGEKVLETRLSQTERLDISSLPAGTYILSVQNKQRIENHKIVKL